MTREQAMTAVAAIRADMVMKDDDARADWLLAYVTAAESANHSASPKSSPPAGPADAKLLADAMLMAERMIQWHASACNRVNCSHPTLNNIVTLVADRHDAARMRTHLVAALIEFHRAHSTEPAPVHASTPEAAVGDAAVQGQAPLYDAVRTAARALANQLITSQPKPAGPTGGDPWWVGLEFSDGDGLWDGAQNETHATMVRNKMRSQLAQEITHFAMRFAK